LVGAGLKTRPHVVSTSRFADPHDRAAFDYDLHVEQVVDQIKRLAVDEYDICQLSAF
jgi:hypothetical protein